MENYYIYTTSYGNGAITYCGAGHGSVTGPTTRNNDERKLFINVIVNSAEAVKEKPTLYVYDPDHAVALWKSLCAYTYGKVYVAPPPPFLS